MDTTHPTRPTDAGDPGHPSTVLTVLTVIVASSLQLVVLVPFTVASGLLAPAWAVVGLFLLWACAAAVLVVLARRRPLLTPLVPLSNAGLLAAVIMIGERLLGWTG